MSEQPISDRAQRWASMGPAPTGLSEEARSGDDGPLSERAQRWATGGNKQGTDNGYDTEFYRKMFEGREQAAEEGTLATYFEDGGTGVVTYDHKSSDGQKRFSFGDVFEDGQYKGNLYDVYADDTKTADLIMADLTMSREERAQTYSNNPINATKSLREEVQAKRHATEKEVQNFESSRQYQGEVQERVDDLTEGAGDEALGLGAGIAGGAAVGATIGTFFGPGVGTAIGAGIGGLVGGIGGWLNRDELTNQYARAAEKTERAYDEHGLMAGASEVLSGFGGISQLAIQPMSNITKGIYDLNNGGTGDGQAAYYEMNDQGEFVRPGIMKAATTGAAILDSISYISGAGGIAFSASMMGSITGGMGELIFTGGERFNDRSGEFESVVRNAETGELTPGRTAAALGNIGIDAVQMFAARGVGKAALGSNRAVAVGTGETISPGLTEKLLVNFAPGSFTGKALKRGNAIVPRNGFLYEIDRATGKAVGNRKMTMSIFAPSEFVQNLNASLRARMVAGSSKDVVALTADDFYRAATDFAMGNQAVRNALVNGFGEGMEEGMQAVLEPLQFGESIPGFETISDAMLQGFAMGVGIGIGGGVSGASNYKQMHAQYAFGQMQHQLPVQSFEEWNKQSDYDKRESVLLSKMERELGKTAGAKLMRDMKATVLGNIPEYNKAVKAATTAKLLREKKINKSINAALVIAQHDDTDLPGYVAGTSMKGALRLFDAFYQGNLVKIERLEEKTGRTAEEDAQLEHLRLVQVQAEEVAAVMRQGDALIDSIVEDLKSSGGKFIQRDLMQAINMTNDLLMQAFLNQNGQTHIDPKNGKVYKKKLTAAERLARQEAVTILNGRHPIDNAGSFLALVPQLSMTLTRYEGHNGIQLGHSVLKSIGGDYDGDKLQTLARMDLWGADREMLLSGANLLLADGKVNIGTRTYEKDFTRWMGEGLRQTNTDLSIHAAGFVDSIHQQLADLIGVPAVALDQFMLMFTTQVKSANPEAAVNLMNAIVKKYPGQVLAVGLSGKAGNGVLEMDKIIQRGYQEFQTVRARDIGRKVKKTKEDERFVRDYGIPVEQQSDVSNQGGLRAATPGQTAGIVVAADDMFRIFQHLKYGLKQGSTVGDLAENDPLLLALQQTFRELSRGAVDEKMDEIQSRDDITQFAQYLINGLAKSGKRSASRNAAVIANMQVPNYDSNGKFHGNNDSQTISVAQWALREALARDKANKGSVWDNLPELQARHRQLEKHLQTMKKNKKGKVVREGHSAQAFAAIYSATPLGTLVGDDAAHLAGVTVGQFIQRYVASGLQERRSTKESIEGLTGWGLRRNKENPPYTTTEVKNGEISPIRSVTDAMIEAGNKRIALDKDYNAIGEIAELANETHDQGVEAMRQIIASFTSMMGKDYNSKRSVKSVKQIFKQRPEWAAQALEIIPDELTPGVITPVKKNGRTEVLVAPWVYEMLTMEPEEAMMHYWRNIQLTSLHLALANQKESEELQYTDLKNNFHRLLYRMNREDPMAYDAFIVELENATNLPAYIRELNRKYGNNGTIFTTWANDVADFSPDKDNGGWSSTSPGATQRESIKAFNRASASLVDTIAEEMAVQEANAEVIPFLEEGVKKLKAAGGRKVYTGANGQPVNAVPEAVANDPDVKSFVKWDRMVELAKVRFTVLGPNSIQDEALGALLGLYDHSADKGKVPTHLRGIGSWLINRVMKGFNVPHSQHSEALTASRFSSINSNLAQAFNGGRFIAQDGTVVEWPPLTSEYLLEKMAESPRMNAAVRNLVYPTVWDTTVEGKVGEQFITGPTLKELLDDKNDIDELLFSGSLRGDQLYAAELNSIADHQFGGDMDLIKQLNEQAIVHSLASASEYTVDSAASAINGELQSIAKAFKIIGALVAQGWNPEDIHKAVIDGARRKSGFKFTDDPDFDQKYAQDLAVVIAQDRVQYIDDLITEKIEQADPTNPGDLRTEIEALEAQKERVRLSVLRRVQSVGNYQDVINRYAYNSKEQDESAKAAMRTNLFYHAQATPGLAARVPDALYVASQINAIEDRSGATMPLMDDADWSLLSRSLIAYHLDDQADNMSGGVTLAPYPEDKLSERQKYYDPNSTFLLTRLLDITSPLVKASVYLHERSGQKAPKYSSADLVQHLSDTLFNPEKMADWNNALPKALIEANPRLNSAPSEQATAAAGLERVRQEAQSVATEGTGRVPPPELLSTVHMTFDELKSGAPVQNKIKVMQEDGTITEADYALEAVEFNGRYANNASISYRNKQTGATVFVPIWNGRPLDPMDPTGPARMATLGREYIGAVPGLENMPYRMISEDQLRMGIYDSVPLNGDGTINTDIVDTSSITYTIDMFHPASQPAEGYYNSVVFEGLANELGAQQQASLNGAYWASASGAANEATNVSLSSGKTGSNAYTVSKLPTFEETKIMELPWTTDLAKVLKEKAKKLTLVDPGSGQPLAIIYNAMLKRMKMQHVVRGVDTDGKPVVWTAEQVIEFQLRNPSDPLPLNNAQLVVLSEDAVNTLLGDKGVYNIDPLSGEAENVDHTDVRPYEGITPEMLARVPGLTDQNKDGTFVKKDLFETDIIDRRARSEWSQRSPKLRSHEKTYQAGIARLRTRKSAELAKRASNEPFRNADRDVWNQRGQRLAQEALEDMKAVFDLTSFGNVPMHNPMQEDVSKLILDELAKVKNLENLNTWFIFEFGSEETAATGVLSEVNIDASRKSFQGAQNIESTLGDNVVIRLESFGRNGQSLEEQIRNAKKAVDYFMAAGSNIILVNSKGAKDLATYLENHIKGVEGGTAYKGLAGSRHVFVPITSRTNQATRRALDAQLAETHEVSAAGRMQVFFGMGVVSDENGMFLTPGIDDQHTVRVDILPTEMFDGIVPPIQADDVLFVKKQLGSMKQAEIQAMAKDAGYTKEETAELIKAIQKTANDYAAKPEFPLAKPAPGQEFEIGEVVPYIDPVSRDILLYRHGHEAPKVSGWELKQQFKAQRKAGRKPAIIVYSAKTMGDIATVHTGTVVKYNTASIYGQSATLRMPLQRYFAKLVGERTGMKWVTSGMPENIKFPSFSPFRNWGIDAVTDIHSDLAKQGHDDIIFNHRTAIAFLGVDFTKPLVKTLFHEDWDSLSDKDKAMYRDKLNQTLIALSKGISIPETQAHTMLREPAVAAAAAQELYGDVNIDGLGLSSTWLTDVFDSTSQEQELTRLLLITLMTPGTRPEHILKSGSFSNPDARTNPRAKSIRMKRLFTDALDTTPNRGVHTYVMDMYREQHKYDGTEGYYLDDNFLFHIINKDDGDNMVGWLGFPEIHSADHSPTLDAMADERKNVEKHSPSTAAIVRTALGGNLVQDVADADMKQFFQNPKLMSFKKPEDIKRLMTSFATEKDTSYQPWKAMTMTASTYMKMGRARNRGYWKAVDMGIESWGNTDAERQAAREQTTEHRNRLARYMGLNESDYEVVDYMVRYQNGQSLDEKGGNMTAREYEEGLKLVERNLMKGLLPTTGGAVPRLDYHLLQKMYRGYKSGRGKFALMSEAGANGTPLTTWEDWLHASLGQSAIGDATFHPMFTLDYDAVTHTYMNAENSLSGLPVSYDDLVNEALLDPDTGAIVLSLSESVNLKANERVYLEGRLVTIEEALGAEFINGELRPKAPKLEGGHHRAAAWAAWSRRNNVREIKETTVENFKKRGVEDVGKKTAMNTAMHVALNLRAGMALVNPALWVSALGETAIRNALENMTGILMGTSTTRLGKMTSGISQEDMAELHQTIASLGGDDRFVSMVYAETMFQMKVHSNAGWLERTTGRLAQAGTRMQDPAHRMRANVLARRYVESVLEYLNTLPTENIISVKMLAHNLRENPNWVEDNLPRAHSMGLRAVENSRSLKATPISKAINGIVNPLTESPYPWIATGSTLALKLPLMFATYGANVFTNITGLQGPMAALAMSLHRRKNPFGRYASLVKGQDAMPTEDGYFDMTDVFESVDLSRAFIQSGLTHTAIMAFALMSGGLGLGGEDDEDKRRRRAAAYQGVGYVYDPRKIENDFRNADAIFLDKIPIISALFQHTDENGETTAMVQPHWMLRQFLSPIIGLERFMETGDYRQIMWGYQDAMGAFPLINSGSWEKAIASYTELTTLAAENERQGTPEGVSDSYYLLLSIGAAFESMLFENSFVNTLYMNADKYDRDPWVLPQTDGEGNIVRDELSQPQKTSALQAYLDDNGQPAKGYVSREWMDAQIHGLAENRATLALFGALFTGLQGKPNDYNRYNMAVKERKIDLKPMEEDVATGMILSLYDAESGNEVLTENGARAVFEGVWHRSVQLGDASLEGIYVTPDMRKSIQEKMIADLVQEGLNQGMGTEAAARYANTIYYGSDTNPWATPMRDIVWSDAFSWGPTARYQQLNTTYVIGPDGRPWATGVRRGDLMTAFGQALGAPVPGGTLQGYYQGDVGNLDVDSRLNSTDPVAGINTGLRALNRVDESWDIPTDEEIGKSIEEAFEKALKDAIPNSYGYGNGYGGGGGGGGGYSARMNTPERTNIPYTNKIPFLNSNNPYTHRARIYRERFTSQRGRLKPWQ